MKLSKTIVALTLSSSVMLATTNAASVIAVNFMRTVTNAPALNDGSEFGISTWVDVLANNDAGGSGIDQVTTDGVTFTWGGGAWSGGGAPTAIHQSYVDNATAFTVTGLGAWLTANSATGYTIQIMQGSDTASNTFGDILLRETNSAGLLLETIGTTGDTKFSTSSSAGAHSVDTLYIDPTNTNGTRTSVSGIIITAVPEPSSAALISLGGISLLLRRRK
ncbi:PEP-CTERM sorting domain-containing protein [Verrucomicrobiaceae bacterium N1E253]|uniref:PEP-CTERM sorting domain-containing protein n=1 Tax=Oceaniferula marina TaxID=2748318 RepID=A0A851GQX0_9BACT|nr:PEP-CTERM sorting domain-containing protein [Oceaniferula marina]NWK57515.1 PEP-CTERM sorting domain-containing protein [Oceaniferula marina]